MFSHRQRVAPSAHHILLVYSHNHLLAPDTGTAVAFVHPRGDAPIPLVCQHVGGEHPLEGAEEPRGSELVHHMGDAGGHAWSECMGGDKDPHYSLATDAGGHAWTEGQVKDHHT